jgi:hypothetical protein
MTSSQVRVFVSIVLLASAAATAGVRVERIGDSTDPKTAEIHGVGAGPFDPAMWQAGRLNLVPDIRRPLLTPRDGKFRNIYAPSVVETPDGWRVFYGGWDGVPTGNDRIYSVDTRDFVTFGERQTVIEHGVFHHVCNVNALRHADGSYIAVCTAYPDAERLNKPAIFTSLDGRTWNGSPAPHAATRDDLITMSGYEKFAAADINGMNVLLREDDRYRLYFGNFRDFGRTYRASSADGKHFTFDGKVHDGRFAVNDVKRFRTAGGEDWHLMGLHMNGPVLSYALSRDGMAFPPARTLLGHAGDDDRHIVALGWVVRGEQDAPGRALLGVLYGAGAAKTLDANRIFARWLQRRVVLVAGDGTCAESGGSLGPDRQVLAPGAGRLEVFAEDGVTRLGSSDLLTIEPGVAYRLSIDP